MIEVESMKKVTMKDIAREANVSVATVSYILNNVVGQTIPEATKCKVLDIARKLNYVPNLTARSLVKRKTGLIGILISRNEEEGSWKRFYYSSFIDQLEQLLTTKGYHVVISSLDAVNPRLEIIREREFDGVFILDVRKEVFYQISVHFPVGVPIVVVDSLIEDQLFHKVLPNFESAIAKAKESLDRQASFLVTDQFNNNEVMNQIMNASGLTDEHVYIMDTEEGLLDFLKKYRDQRGIVINEFIGAIVTNYILPQDVAVICTCDCPYILPLETAQIRFNKNKSAIAFNVMMKHINREESEYENDEKDKTILIKAE